MPCRVRRLNASFHVCYVVTHTQLLFRFILADITSSIAPPYSICYRYDVGRAICCCKLCFGLVSVRPPVCVAFPADRILYAMTYYSWDDVLYVCVVRVTLYPRGTVCYPRLFPVVPVME